MVARANTRRARSPMSTVILSSISAIQFPFHFPKVGRPHGSHLIPPLPPTIHHHRPNRGLDLAQGAVRTPRRALTRTAHGCRVHRSAHCLGITRVQYFQVQTCAFFKWPVGTSRLCPLSIVTLGYKPTIVIPSSVCHTHATLSQYLPHRISHTREGGGGTKIKDYS